VRYLDLNSGRAGDLLAIGERISVMKMSLTRDRSALVLTRTPWAESVRRSRFQIWNYAALCREAGLEY
jgi:hypothetical protein